MARHFPTGTNRKTGGHRRIQALSTLVCLMSLFAISPIKVFAADQTAAPNEKILYKNGPWETAFWGDEGRMAYRYAGSGEITGEAPLDTFEQEFTVDAPTLLRSVVTVHTNDDDNSTATLKSVINGEAGVFDAAWPETDGEIALTDEEGTVYGPFQCKIGSPAVINGEIQPYMLWVADTGELRLEPGKYIVLGSKPETLVINDETGNQPALLLKGVDAAQWDEYVGKAGAGRSFQGSYQVEVQDEDGNTVTDPVEFGMIDNGDSVEVVGVVADMPVDQSLGVISRTDDTIEAGGSVSLPVQGLFELSLNTTIRLENGEWVFSGEWNFSQNINGDNYVSASTFKGKMIGRDMPGYFFPKPAAGLGSLGNIPGPANETQAAAGVVAPGLLALLASVIAGRGRSGGGSGGAAMFMQPAGPAPEGGGGAGLSQTTGMHGENAGAQSVTLETPSHKSGIPHNLSNDKTGFIQANSDARHIQSMLDGNSSAGGDALSQSIQKAMSQIVDTPGGNVLNDLSTRVANDVASGGLSDFGFSGGDMLKAAARSIDADDMLAGPMGLSALQTATDESKQLQVLDILSRIFKPRTNLPEDLIKAAQNRANIR